MAAPASTSSGRWIPEDHLLQLTMTARINVRTLTEQILRQVDRRCPDRKRYCRMSARHAAPERLSLAEQSLDDNDEDDHDRKGNKGDNIVRRFPQVPMTCL